MPRPRPLPGPPQFYAAVTRAVAQRPPPMSVFRGYPKPDMRQVYCSTRECSAPGAGLGCQRLGMVVRAAEGWAS